MDQKLKFFPLVFLSLLVLSSSLVLAQEQTCSVEVPCEDTGPVITVPGSHALNDSGLCIYFFYGQGCPHCARIEPFIEEISQKYPKFSVIPLEIYRNSTNRALFDNFNERYGIPSEGPNLFDRIKNFFPCLLRGECLETRTRGIPEVFIGDRALIGEDAIKNNLEPSIVYFTENSPICPLEYNISSSGSHGTSPTEMKELTLFTVIFAALVDSINPCAFAVIAFLLSYLASIGAKERILKIGLVYSSVVFIVYFLSGIGLFSVIQTTGMTLFVYKLAAVIAIIAGIINLKDFFWYGKGITLRIPTSKKDTIKKYVHQATLPAAIILGILVSLFELPCTGEVYLVILAMLSSKMTLAAGLPYLIIYNLIFVLPLVIITFIFQKEAAAEKVNLWRIKYRKWMKLGVGILLLLLGIFMIFEML